MGSARQCWVYLEHWDGDNQVSQVWVEGDTAASQERGKGMKLLDAIENREQPLGEIPAEILTYWKNAHGHGVADLAHFLQGLADRQAVIAFPRYERLRPANVREDEWVTSPANRHGKLVGLVSNESVFSFSA